MIAIAIAASLIAYAWVIGYMDFTTTKVGKAIQIQSITPDYVNVQNVGDSDVEISVVYVDGVLDSSYGITVDCEVTSILGWTKTAQIDFIEYNGAGCLLSTSPETQVTIKVLSSDGMRARIYIVYISSQKSNSGEYEIDFLL